MAVFKKKTKKALSKQIKKAVRKHGPEVALGLVSGMVTELIASTRRKRRK